MNGLTDIVRDLRRVGREVYVCRRHSRVLYGIHSRIRSIANCKESYGVWVNSGRMFDVDLRETDLKECEGVKSIGPCGILRYDSRAAYALETRPRTLTSKSFVLKTQMKEFHPHHVVLVKKKRSRCMGTFCKSGPVTWPPNYWQFDK